MTIKARGDGNESRVPKLGLKDSALPTFGRRA